MVLPFAPNRIRESGGSGSPGDPGVRESGGPGVRGSGSPGVRGGDNINQMSDSRIPQIPSVSNSQTSSGVVWGNSTGRVQKSFDKKDVGK